MPPLEATLFCLPKVYPKCARVTLRSSASWQAWGVLDTLNTCVCVCVFSTWQPAWVSLWLPDGGGLISSCVRVRDMGVAEGVFWIRSSKNIQVEVWRWVMAQKQLFSMEWSALSLRVSSEDTNRPDKWRYKVSTCFALQGSEKSETCLPLVCLFWISSHLWSY